MNQNEARYLWLRKHIIGITVDGFRLEHGWTPEELDEKIDEHLKKLNSDQNSEMEKTNV